MAIKNLYFVREKFLDRISEKHNRFNSISQNSASESIWVRSLSLSMQVKCVMLISISTTWDLALLMYHPITLPSLCHIWKMGLYLMPSLLISADSWQI